MPKNDKTFVRITNQDIYKEVLDIKHHVMKTNGKVRMNKWIATTALSFVVILIGVIARGG